MKQKTKQLIMTLVALLALTTHAWAMWTGGTYTATDNEINLNSVNVTDNATLTINQGFTVTIGSITISAGKTLTVVGPGHLDVGGITGSGTIIVKGNASLRVYGADGSDGAPGENGSDGGDGAAAIMCSITIYSGSIQAYGGHGGAGGEGDGESGTGGEGGDAGPAFGGSGTLTYYGGSIEAYSGSSGSGGVGAVYGESGEQAMALADTYNVVFENQPTSIQDAYNNPIDINNIKGAWDFKILGDDADAVTGTTVAITWSAATPNTASIDKMPAGNVTVSVDYFAQAEFAMSTDTTPVPLAPAPIPGVPANTDAPIVTAGTVANIGTSDDKQGTLMYFVSQSTGNTVPEAPDYDTKGWSEDVPTANGLAEGDVYVWYYIKGAEPATIAERTDANTRSDSDIMPLGTNGIVTLGAEPTYDVSLNKTGIDITDQTLAVLAHRTDITPDVDLVNEDLKGVKKGETVTVSYTGTKRVAGVKAVKKVNVVNLSTLNGNYEAQNGDILTGKLVGNYKVSIADGATVTLAGVTIEGVNSDSYEWAGISCEGNATIVVEDGTSNSVKGFDLKLPGIQVSGDSKLTIKGGSLGTGSLVASSNGAGAGIGGAFNDYCGEIEIQGGNITATGGRGAAGIGGGEDGFWGDIIISGGQVKAIGGNGAAGIGSGYAGDENIYGNISIMGGTVNAIGGNGGPGIGSGCGEQGNPSILTAYCRDITISGGTVMATGGDGAAGIGSGSEKSTCGTITITSTVNNVTATKGSDAPNSIGAGKDSTCGEVTIEDPDKVTQN